MLTKYLDHFCKHVPGGVSRERPVLVVCDGHESRLDLNFIEVARARGVHVLLMPGKLSPLLQPCDQMFAAYKQRLGALRADFATYSLGT